MLNRAIKYYVFPLLIISGRLFAQPGENPVSNEQQINIEPPSLSSNASKTVKEINSRKSITLQVQAESKFNEEISHGFFKQNHEIPAPKKNEESVFNILSASYRNNIRFGGFWDKYAIVNFSPSVYIRPLENISIYANHNFSCFIPIGGIKEHMEMLCIQGAAIMAIDNSVKFIFGANKMIPSIAGFALKTIIINSVMSTINRNKKNKILDFRNYYYSVSIRF